jgi:hypothetical protein
VHTGPGIALIVAAVGLLLLTALVLRRRIPQTASDLLAALGGAGVGVGGLLLLHRDVNTASWIAAPVMLGALSVWHLRVLFGGSGPFRT